MKTENTVVYSWRVRQQPHLTDRSQLCSFVLKWIVAVLVSTVLLHRSSWKLMVCASGKKSNPKVTAWENQAYYPFKTDKCQTNLDSICSWGFSDNYNSKTKPIVLSHLSNYPTDCVCVEVCFEQLFFLIL